MQETDMHLPIIIVAGFLGTGKTTLIRELLPPLIASKRMPHVILNDFLNAAIDSHTLSGLGAEIKAIAAGCVCCDDAGSLVRALLAVPRNPQSIVIMEANGTTDPFRLIEIITLTPSLRDVVGKIVQITVINESRWGKRWLSGDTLTERAQLRTASAILRNRGEKASEKQRQRVTQDISELNPHALVMEQDGIIRLLQENQLLEILPQPTLNEAMEHRHLHVAIQVVPPMMSIENLRKWLISLPREIIRIKGLARISDTEMAYFQRTDDALEAPRIVKTLIQEGMAPAAVFIGPGVQESMIVSSFLQPTAAVPAFDFRL